MLKKHYGRWIPKDTRSMAEVVTRMLGYEKEASEGLKGSDLVPKQHLKYENSFKTDT